MNGHGEDHVLQMSWWSVLPFVGLLLCVAVLPLIRRVSHWWDSNASKVWVSVLFALPAVIGMAVVGHFVHGTVHALIEFCLFFTLLFTLFRISANVCVTGDLQATPGNNTRIIAIGAALASVFGTTGAAMLLIRFLLSTNKERRHVAHTVVFFIFCVANCGGCLLPGGDPPLFMGMMRGVPFWWTLSLWKWWLLVNGLLLIVYYALDSWMYSQETVQSVRDDKKNIVPWQISGKSYVALMLLVAVAMAVVPSIDLEHLGDSDLPWTAYVPWREFVFLGFAGIAIWRSDSEVLRKNHFHWHPIVEVGVLFFGIFQTMVPALMFVSQLAPSLPLSPPTYFASAGTLSAFLDNAPTYVVFFEIAKARGGDALVAGVPAAVLVAISLGSVFCGAMTYIGNGPNFMVKAIAESKEVRMPTFFGYMGYSVAFLLPILIVLALVAFFPNNPAANMAGWSLALAIVFVSAVVSVRYQRVRARIEDEFKTAVLYASSPDLGVEAEAM